ncbi:carboxymuconolactone decarboxylase family protein [Pokkaliibacter sp. MBI-7]|uniref:carboxymuconolactone decarboxylase family protein n=1 Tax=Pokkaliibacter sp. MBI-7 TaxID=3040600 RepID=UPI002447CE9A|nr:carboxymuconolactone decarboxylase family protein [Pokkaliibacter sp. MBI-7]MDH2432073.1 carboxymuconolactone decarboxylase family protein [Pokkaliibacter sp. MBI-7]
MSQRIDYIQATPALFKTYLDANNAVKQHPAIQQLGDLITIRASQLNGCGFCLDMHVKEARIHGERELRVHHIAIWRESALFSARERAALLWTEVLTRLPEHGVDDATYAIVREQLSEEELSAITFLIAIINGWNRISIGFKAVPGSADAAYGLDKAGLV